MSLAWSNPPPSLFGKYPRRRHRGFSPAKIRPATRLGAAQNLPLFTPAIGAYITPMFADFLKRLTQPEPDQLPDTDARLALTALLVRIARSDDSYDGSEIARIDRIIATRYGLSPHGATELRGQAETLESQAPDTVRFTRAIKDAVPYVDREGVIEALWEVVLADGVRDHEEDVLLRLVANLLGVNDRDSNLARQRVQARSE